LITRIIFSEYRLLSFSLCNFLHSPVTSSFLGLNIPFRTLFWNSRLAHCEQPCLHPYKTSGKIIVPYYLSIYILDSKLEAKMFCTEW
jgi:hypothetical protein